MKKLFISTLCLLSFSAAADFGKIEEEVFIQGTEHLKVIKTHPALTIDHLSKSGFELYGPKGMKKWLDDAGIDYQVNSHHNHGHHNKNGGMTVELQYPTFEQIEANLKALVAKNPKIAKLFSIGKSVQGRDLYVVKISDNVEKDELEPEFKYISSMHGDEITGRELTQFLIKDIIEGYGVDSKITELVNNTEIYIMPSMNPDGSNAGRRANANGQDLNRNFPDWTRGDVNTSARRQPETQAVMKFQAERKFSLSANFHGGAVVANYPWDSTYERHPLDNLVQELSLVYANENPAMRNSREFSRGITNGADWYVLHGGMQDWSYFWYNDLQITIELSDRKWPRYSQIPSFYKDNKESMLQYVRAIHQGAGFVTKSNKATGKVKIIKNLADGSELSLGSFGFDKGEFYKVLTKGEYTFHVTVNGEGSRSFKTHVDDSIRTDGNFTVLN